MDIDKLELSVETLRELNDEDLTRVAGGAQVTNLCLTGNETYYCPTIGQGYPQCAIAVTGACG
jgi:hypothetical protein